MAITQNERIFDLAYGAKYGTATIADILGISQAMVESVLANLSAGPSAAVSPIAGAETSPGGEAAALYGNQRQVGNTSRPGRSNLDYLGLSGCKDEATGAATKFGVSVPIPVKAGDVISKIGLFVGETAFSTMTASQAALYEGKGAKPALLAESTSVATELKANEIFFWTLKAALTVTETNAPNGFIYVNYVAVGTIGTCLISPTEVKLAVIAKEGEKVAGKETPLFIAASNKPAAEEGVKPEAKLETTLTAIAKAPLMILV